MIRWMTARHGCGVEGGVGENGSRQAINKKVESGTTATARYSNHSSFTLIQFLLYF
jgi:hypothetical protein